MNYNLLICEGNFISYMLQSNDFDRIIVSLKQWVGLSQEILLSRKKNSIGIYNRNDENRKSGNN